MLETIEKIVDGTKLQLSLPASKTRETEGLLNIFKNIAEVEFAIQKYFPLSAILDNNNKVYIAYGWNVLSIICFIT